MKIIHGMAMNDGSVKENIGIVRFLEKCNCLLKIAKRRVRALELEIQDRVIFKAMPYEECMNLSNVIDGF